MSGGRHAGGGVDAVAVVTGDAAEAGGSSARLHFLRRLTLGLQPLRVAQILVVSLAGAGGSAAGGSAWGRRVAPSARDDGNVAAATVSGESAGAALTPRPTCTPHRKMTTATIVVAMNRKTSCFPLN